MYIPVHTHLHIHIYGTTINGERRHEFKREQAGDIWGVVWKEERKGGNYVIIISKNKYFKNIQNHKKEKGKEISFEENAYTHE